MRPTKHVLFLSFVLSLILLHPSTLFALEGGSPGGPGDGSKLDAVHPSFDLTDLRPLGFNEKIGGMDFLPDGRLVVSTWTGLLSHGGKVFILSNVDQDDRSLITAKEIASGLAEPLALKVFNGAIYVAEKKQVTQLVDTNGDDIIDEYNVFASGFPVTDNFHMFSFGLEIKNGYFWMALSNCVIAGGLQCPADHPDNVGNRGSLLRINLDPARGPLGTWEIVATGLRSPNGMGVGVDGEIFGGDNQGTWLPTDKINHYRTDEARADFHTNFGHQNSIPSLYQHLPTSPPAIYLDHGAIGLSPSQLSLFPPGTDYAGQMMHGDVALGGIRRDFMEQVAGNYQGVVFRFTQGLEAGVNRLITHDGDLYVGGVGDSGNWNEPGKLLFGLQRLRPNGKTTFEMLTVKSRANGFEIEFTAPLDFTAALNPANYLVKHWHYVPTEAYGGQRVDEASLTVSHVSISDDYKKVFLEIPNLVPGKVVYFKLNNIRSHGGTYPWSTEAFYTLNAISPTPGPAFTATEEPPPESARLPENPSNTINGLYASNYYGDWAALPDFSKLTPSSNQIKHNFEIPTGEENFGYVFRGYIDIKEQEEVTFYTASDDGSRLWIGSKLVVDNDGLHGLKEEQGSIKLAPGKHEIRVEYFNGGYEGILNVSYSSPSIAKRKIPADVLFRKPSTLEMSEPYHQAEAAGLKGTCVENNHLGFTGLGFVGCFGDAGDAIQIPLVVEYAGEYQMRTRYARGYVHGSFVWAASVDIYVNGLFVKTASFPPVGFWTSWGITTETLSLKAGFNTVEFRNTLALDSAINVDRIEVVKRFEHQISSPPPIDCPATAYAIDCRQDSVPYLAFPHEDPGGNFSELPPLLSQTGAFSNLELLTPSIGIIPFEPIAPLWSDGAGKFRWISLPSGTQIQFSRDGNWIFPEGTVLIKQFELYEEQPVYGGRWRRLETRFLIKTATGWYGATYRWRNDFSDADLLVRGLDESFPVRQRDGTIKQQTWSYPSPADCMSCHNSWSSGALGLKTGQLNSSYVYAKSSTVLVDANQLKTWNHLGLFSPALDESALPSYPKFSKITDASAPVEERLKSYWDVNCGQCHGSDPTIAALWDARYKTPLSNQGIVRGPVVGFNPAEPRYVVNPGNLQNSELYRRDSIRGPGQMPPLGSHLVDETYLALLSEWINGLPSRPDNFDLFSNPILLKDAAGNNIAPMNLSLLPNGQVHVIGKRIDQQGAGNYSNTTGLLINSGIYDPVPSVNTLQELSPPYEVLSEVNETSRIDDSLEGAGLTFTSSGDLFIAGGSRVWTDLVNQDQISLGLPYAMTYNGSGAGFKKIETYFLGGGSLLSEPHRSYSTATLLPDSRVLLTGGLELSSPAIFQSPNRSIEIFSPSTGQFNLIAPQSSVPSAIASSDYTTVFQLPGKASGEMLMFGATGQPVFFSVSSGQFLLSEQYRPSYVNGKTPNMGASSALLPVRVNDGEWGYKNGSIILVGGESGTLPQQQIDVYDPVVDSWLPSIDMLQKRSYSPSVILPDGKILLLPSVNSSETSPSGKTQIFDPQTKTFVTGIADVDVSTRYQTVSILLADGRVLLGGGGYDSHISNQYPKLQYYYPPYIFKPRPLLFSDDVQINSGDSGLLIWLSDNSISEVVLMGLGSTTKSTDMNQRHIQLKILGQTPLGVHESGLNWGAINYQIPEDKSVIPGGYYMLMVLDERRVPSIAKIIQVK